MFWRLLRILTICPPNDGSARKRSIWSLVGQSFELSPPLHYLPTPLTSVFALLVVNGNNLCSRYTTPRKAFRPITSAFILLHSWLHCFEHQFNRSYQWSDVLLSLTIHNYRLISTSCLESIQRSQMVIVSHALWSSAAPLLFRPQIHPKIWRSKIIYRLMTESSQNKKKNHGSNGIFILLGPSS